MAFDFSKERSLTFPCPPKAKKKYWVLSRCNGDRDCLDDDRMQEATLSELICGAGAWNAPDERRYTEIWDEGRSKRLMKITSRYFSSRSRATTSTAPIAGSGREMDWGAHRRARCDQSNWATTRPGGSADPDPFTVDVPGIQDILKVKAWESKQLRYERYKRFETANSAVPGFLKWIPPLLTKLDNAQDMLFTGLALAIPIMKFIAPRFLGPVGILLTINDLVNLLT